MTLTSSHVSQPTSPLKITFVPGLKLNRKSLRMPYAQTFDRVAVGSPL